MLSKDLRKNLKGKLPTLREAADWHEQKYIQFLRFVNFFTVGESFKTTNDQIATAIQRAQEEEYWDEFLSRIGMAPFEKNFTTKKFFYRLVSFIRVPLTHLKRNPHIITPVMWGLMKGNPRMKWATSSFKEVETEVGIKVVELNNREETNPGIANEDPELTDVKSPQVLYNSTLMKMSSLANRLIAGIKQEDITKMATINRIKLANSLVTTLSRSFAAYKPNTAIFNQINIHKGSREDLEKVMLEYAQGQ